MCLVKKGRSTDEQRLDILNMKRNDIISKIHLKEEQIDKLDYLRYKIKSNQS